MKCAEVREMVPAYVDEQDLGLSVRRHLARCADCRAELAEYESLVEDLAGLTSVVADPPPSLVRALVAIPSGASPVEQVVSHLTRNRGAYVGGAAVALLGATGAVLWRSRRNRLVTA